MESTEDKIMQRIHEKGPGWTFFKNDFGDIGNLNTIDRSLRRLEDKGLIRRIMRGLYDIPKFSKLLKQYLSPDIHLTAEAIARKFGWQIQPTGSTALNALGLSTQIPTRYTYLCDGRNITYEIGNIEIEFKKRSLKEINFKYGESALLVQALKALDKRTLSDKDIEMLRDRFSPDMQERILEDTKYTTSWIYETIKNIFNTKMVTS
jgi:hypothetical protein